MKAEYLIKKQLINDYYNPPYPEDRPKDLKLDTEEQVENEYQRLQEDWILQDAQNEFRESGEDVGLSCKDWSRHYESKTVGCELDDGTWVSWIYWYGGGKHGEPEAIDWMGDANILEIAEEKEVIKVERTFKIKE